MGGSKDADMSPFECGRRLLEPGAGRLSIDERLQLYFQDADLVPLLVQVHMVHSFFCRPAWLVWHERCLRLCYMWHQSKRRRQLSVRLGCQGAACSGLVHSN